MLVEIAVGVVRLQALTYRALGALRGGLNGAASGLLAEALTADELGDVTARFYDTRLPGRRRAGQVVDPGPGRYSPAFRLFAGESEWFEAYLPAPPARILVGGAGRGREVAALLEMGYDVDAFDPVHSFCADCQMLAGVGIVVCADYGSFARALLDGDKTSASPLTASAPYAAVILGWTSFDFVFSSFDRERLLRAVHAIAPRGPILASFHVREQPPGGRAVAFGHAAGQRVGRAVRHLRGLSDPPPDAELHCHLGVIQWSTRQEIQAVGAIVGREVVWESRDHGLCATQPAVPAAAPSESPSAVGSWTTEMDRSTHCVVFLAPADPGGLSCGA